MIVREQQDVDRRQLPGAQTGRREALGAERRQGRGVFGQERVGQDGPAVEAGREAVGGGLDVLPAASGIDVVSAASTAPVSS